MLLYYVTPADLAQRDDPKKAAEYMGAWGAYIGAMSAAGVMSSGQGLQPPQTASTVRVRNGKRQVQDGPYADTREHLGGYVIVDVPTLDDALAWASRAPCNATGATQVIPVADMSAHMPAR
jgi:hypothetical protein